MKLYPLFLAVLTVGLATPTLAQQKTATSEQEVRQQIEALSKKYDEAFNKHDVVGVVAAFAQDAIIMPEGPMLAGMQAITKNYEDFFKNANPNPDHVSKVVQVKALGDNAAWVVGEWSVTVPGPNNTTQQLHGNWGAVDEREGGQWKAHMLTWNMIEPPPAETAAAPGAGASGSTVPSK
jgi:uncharacterized protein (TIGR02246 family)